jgi:hypothetical protein
MNLRLSTTVIILFACCCCGQTSQTLSDGEAKIRIEKYWEAGDLLMFPLGQLTVIGGLGVSPDRKIAESKRELDRGGFVSMQIFEQMGIVAISQQEDLTKRFTTWENWLSMTQNGVQARIIAKPGPQAGACHCDEQQQAAAMKVYGDTNVLCISKGHATIEKIVQNEARTVGVDHYRAVLGTHVWTASPIMQEFYRRAGQPQKAERKFMAALKYDPFDSEWHVVAQDIADRDATFLTRNVNDLLAQK